MKFQLWFLIMVTLLSGCGDRIDPVISTIYLEEGDRAAQRRQAIPELYAHYQNSAKDREAYEVISKKNGRFIINYVPGLELLTLCGDPGSGWSRQFANVSDDVLKILVNEKVTFDDLEIHGSFGSKLDSLLISKTPIYRVRTNGSPSL
ncbi:hypothetical protein [Dyadobacter chenhuakuii]|uniref:Lipoprotein n=1 Tax=Dyadobacter chenhuakuii TaxID=2909339 RepID=A0ABY4XFE9_9BACT|nr:hypothetical protein [Dyadobacter chenhuakuii]MCF2492113.1 hypothetical protein [Dyadobacter chenhuakuii]USJ28728.2 hypothetical protein NFI80_12670 [Dyadobacter chenhuakuii]